ncbi:MAG: ectoine synthase [Candidatus Latescibacteria bacterium]|nr:ectoine synthase [Candidatus Latescibacterota bacterium]
MIVRTLDQIIGTARDVGAQTWTSRRLLLKEDGMGFSLHETLVRAGTETSMWYKHHVEAAYCIEGEGEVEVVPSGAVYPIAPGTVYALDQHERHLLRATSDLRLVCVFNPPCTGREVHDAEGAYPLLEEEPRQGPSLAESGKS